MTTEYAKIYYIGNKKFNKELKKYRKVHWLVRWLYRSFYENETIHIRYKCLRRDKAKYLNHEVGKMLGMKETWKPNFMNKYWIFRWFNDRRGKSIAVSENFYMDGFDFILKEDYLYSSCSVKRT